MERRDKYIIRVFNLKEYTKYRRNGYLIFGKVIFLILSCKVKI